MFNSCASSIRQPKLHYISSRVLRERYKYHEERCNVVVQRNDHFYHDLDRLSENERNAYVARYAPIPSSIDHKSEILNILTKKFEDLVSVGDKAISISPYSGYRKVDVIPAYQYRNYYRFYNFSEGYDEGIFFFNKDGSQIVNYPKQHSQNLTKKHQATNGRFKPIIRIFKNLNAKLVDNKMLTPRNAPHISLKAFFITCPMNILNTVIKTVFATS